ncbi:MAG: serine/threonine-protein kinase [Acidobacteria bacterium]|nr:serine/threonine-protein kinase [Acidobacteriota bacterium]
MPDGRDDRDDVLLDVADALSLNQRVEWKRCEKLATPSGRRALGNLRALARVFAGGEASGDASPADGSAIRASAVGRGVARALVAIATVEVGATLLLLPWAWGDYHRVHGELAAFLANKLVGHAAAAFLLLAAGRRDRRTRLLGVYCLLKATLPPLHMLQAFFLEIPPPEQYSAFVQALPASNRLFYYLCVPAFLFAPAFLWAFARECPQVHRRARLDDLARRMTQVSVAIGFAIWVGNAVTVQLAVWGYEVSVALMADASLATLDVLALAAVVVVALRAHTAPADEARRVVVFGAGFLMYAGVSAAYNVAEVFSPGLWGANYQWSPTVLLIEVMRFPGMIVLWYSVLAARVPHVREVVRACYRRLLVRPGLLAAAAAAPGVGLGWLALSRPERTVGGLVADPLAQWLFAAAGALLLGALGREQILRRLDSWTHPEATDQRRVLAAAAAALAQAGGNKTAAGAVTRAVKRGCGSPAVLAAAFDPAEAEAFHVPDAAVTPLPRTSAIAHLLETVGGTLRVHPDDESSVFTLLPCDDAAWVGETAADAIVAVPGPGGELVGVLVVGRRFDDRIVRPVDVPFLEALGAAAGLAIGRLRVTHGGGGSTSEASPGRECPDCGAVVDAGDPPGCSCGSTYVESMVPAVLAGKYRLTRRLGAGGMGAAYLARDLRLERHVAVKIATETSVPGRMGLKPEAWAMANVSHSAVAQVYGVESWRGRAFLVVEYLAGGTLADRLRRGAVPEREAVSVAASLADALSALHDAGYIHGDVKPSNIGFTAAESPKLLDFGLARGARDGAIVGGTVRYASPEVLSGRPAEEGDDVWSLCVVLYEMATGEHPFAGDGVDEVTRRVRRRRVGPRGAPRAAARTTSAAAAFAASVLLAARPARPATARAFALTLRAVVGDGA